MTKSDLILLPAAPALGQTLTISGPSLAALRAWAPRLGSAITAQSPAGNFFRARLTGLTESAAEVFVYEEMKGAAESGLELTLLQALPDKERMELIIEKATELGADVIAPWQAERGISLEEREARQPKAHHWQDRALRAAKQCRRARVPFLAPCTDLAGALEAAATAELKIALWEKAETPLKSALTKTRAHSAAILIGPEGGLSEGEAKIIGQAGFTMVSLGPRILRTETAAIAALSLVQFTLGDLGGGGGEGPFPIK